MTYVYIHICILSSINAKAGLWVWLFRSCQEVVPEPVPHNHSKLQPYVHGT